MGEKVGEYDGFVGIGPTMMPLYRKRHFINIRYSRKDIILGILLALVFFYIFYYVCGVLFYIPLPGMR